MRNTRNRTILFGGLTALTLLFIWGNSMLPASASNLLSDWVGRILGQIADGAETEQGHGILRKLAHGTEFLALGVWLQMLLCPRRPWYLPLLLGALAALIDETIQLGSAGRASLVTDVWIDVGGLLLGLGLAALLRRMRTRRRWTRAG